MPALPWYIKSLLLPPASLFLVVLFGAIVLRQRPRLGRACIAVGLVLLYALSTPLVSSWLMRGVQLEPPLTQFDHGSQAIVVLSAGAYTGVVEYGGAAVSATTLERIRYGARLHRRTGLPLLVTGGRVYAGYPSLAELMVEALDESFGVTPRWVESEALNTYQNAVNSAAILHPLGVTRVYLVTHAWHMRRAVASFEAAGFEVLPASTRHIRRPGYSLPYFVPSAGHLGASAWVIHEWLGLAWYSLVYF